MDDNMTMTVVDDNDNDNDNMTMTVVEVAVDVWAMDDVAMMIVIVIAMAIVMARKNPANCCRALTPWEGEPTITSLQQVTGVIMLAKLWYLLAMIFTVYELKICKGTGGWAWPGNVVPVESTLPSARFSIG